MSRCIRGLAASILFIVIAAWSEFAVGQSGPPAPRRPQGPDNAAAQQGPGRLPNQNRPGAAPQRGPAPAGSRPNAGQGGPVQQQRPQQQPAARPAPFQLNPQQLQELDRVLAAWEQRSQGIETFRCTFVRLEDNPVFKTRKESRGILRYAKPDKGLYQITDEGGEHWVSNGKSIFEFNHAEKKLIERTLPPELQGKSITDGPLPFVFNADAKKLKHRYFLRISTPPTVQGQIWIDAHPRFQADAANFQRATLILDSEQMLPFALEIMLTNGQNRTVHTFSDPKVNNKWKFWERDFSEPVLERGWTKVVDPIPSAGRQAARTAPAGNSRVVTGQR